MPTRRSRAVKKSYADDDVVGAGGSEESDDEFDPFRLREEPKGYKTLPRKSLIVKLCARQYD
jgi:hypothetical protein